MSLRLFIIFAWFSYAYNTFAQPELHKKKQIKINEELYYSQITDDVYMITHYFPYYGGNSLFVRLDNMKAVLIDTPYDGVATIALMEWINATFGELELVAIVTGFHQDNLGGNEELIDRNIPIYGMKLTADFVVQEGNELKNILVESVINNANKSYHERYSNLNLVPPSHTFILKKGESKIIDVGSEKFEFFYPGESHTIDYAVVFIHKKNILFGGCMIRALGTKRPGYINYANNLSSILKYGYL